MNNDELRENYDLLFNLHAAAKGGDDTAIDGLLFLGDILLQRILRDQEAAHKERVQSGKARAKKQDDTIFLLVAEAWSRAHMVPRDLRPEGFDVWKNAAKNVHTIASENGIKDPRTVDKYLEKWRPFFEGLKKKNMV